MDTVIALLILGGLTGSIVGVHRWLTRRREDAEWERQASPSGW